MFGTALVEEPSEPALSDGMSMITDKTSAPGKQASRSLRSVDCRPKASRLILVVCSKLEPRIAVNTQTVQWLLLRPAQFPCLRPSVKRCSFLQHESRCSTRQRASSSASTDHEINISQTNDGDGVPMSIRGSPQFLSSCLHIYFIN